MNAPVAETTALISVSTTPAAIAFNYEETRAWLENELERYDVVVTADTLAGSKKLATELNKLATEIGKRRREAVAEVSGPIRLFEEQAKTLEKMCKDGRQRLLDQIKAFDDKVKEKAKAALEKALVGAWEAQEVDEEFRRASIDDLVKLTALTKTGRLAASAIHEISIRVAADKQLQQQTQIRLHLLENDSYRAGLAAPLTRAHVETFLFAPDEEYKQRLQAMIASELERQKVAEERSRQKFEAEQRRAEEAKRKAETRQPEPEPAPDPEPEPTPGPLPEAATAEPAQQVQKHAYGPLATPTLAVITECTQAEAEAQATQLSVNAMTEPFGVWVPSGLITIAYGGEVFRKC